MVEALLGVLSLSLTIAVIVLVRVQNRNKTDISAARAELADKERLVEDLREENRLLRRDIRSHVDSANADEDALVRASQASQSLKDTKIQQWRDSKSSKQAKKKEDEVQQKQRILAHPARYYRSRGSFLSAAEQSFYRSLIEACAGFECEICLKVQLREYADSLQGLSSQKDDDRSLCERTKWNLVFAKHFDFALVRPDGSALAFIELDDTTHETNDATKESDQVKEAFARAMKVPLVRFETKEGPWTSDKIKGRLDQAL